MTPLCFRGRPHVCRAGGRPPAPSLFSAVPATISELSLSGKGRRPALRDTSRSCKKGCSRPPPRKESPRSGIPLCRPGDLWGENLFFQCIPPRGCLRRCGPAGGKGGFSAGAHGPYRRRPARSRLRVFRRPPLPLRAGDTSKRPGLRPGGRWGYGTGNSLPDPALSDGRIPRNPGRPHVRRRYRS